MPELLQSLSKLYLCSYQATLGLGDMSPKGIYTKTLYQCINSFHKYNDAREQEVKTKTVAHIPYQNLNKDTTSKILRVYCISPHVIVYGVRSALYSPGGYKMMIWSTLKDKGD